MNARDRQILNELTKTHLEMVAEAGEDPAYVLDFVLNPHYDLTLYWKTLRGLKGELQAAADLQWTIIQESREWDKTSEFIHDWAVCRFALLKLELAGVARYFKFVGIVDASYQYRCVRDYIDNTAIA